ncbi:MAG: PIG-L deacetylase family protein [Chloroflexota bacterium]
MCVFAHPDDETLGVGSTLAKYAAEGAAISLLAATRGEHGWQGDPQENPGAAALAEIRTGELEAATEVLGVREVHFLGYEDGGLDGVDWAEALGRIVGHVRRFRPQVVITFSPDGAYGHPDHIAISQLATAAMVAAADAEFETPGGEEPHRVAKLYYMAHTREELDLYEQAFGGLAMVVDGVERGAVGWERWAITTSIDGDAHWRTVWEAIRCHESQLPTLGKLDEGFLEAHHRTLLGVCHYYRAYSLVNGGRGVEGELCEGVE